MIFSIEETILFIITIGIITITVFTMHVSKPKNKPIPNKEYSLYKSKVNNIYLIHNNFSCKGLYLIHNNFSCKGLWLDEIGTLFSIDDSYFTNKNLSRYKDNLTLIYSFDYYPTLEDITKNYPELLI